MDDGSITTNTPQSSVLSHREQERQSFLNNTYKDDDEQQYTNQSTAYPTPPPVVSALQPVPMITDIIDRKIQSFLDSISLVDTRVIEVSAEKIRVISSKNMHPPLLQFLSQTEVLRAFYLHNNSFTSKHKPLADHPYYGKTIVIYAPTHKKGGARMDALEFKHQSGRMSPSDTTTTTTTMTTVLNFRNKAEQASHTNTTKKFGNLLWPLRDLPHILQIGQNSIMQNQIISYQENDMIKKKRRWDETVQHMVADKEKDNALEERKEEQQTDPQEPPVIKKKRKQSRKQKQTTEQSNNQNTATTTDDIIRVISPPHHVMQNNQSSVLSHQLQDLQSFLNDVCDDTTADDTLSYDLKDLF